MGFTMNDRLMSYALIVLGLIVIFGASMLIYPYATQTLGSISDFVSHNDLTKMQDCGITPPSQFTKIKSDLNSLILPMLALGLPFVLVIVSGLMFLGGFYYHKSMVPRVSKKKEEREIVQKIVKKMKSIPRKSVEPPTEQEQIPDQKPWGEE